MTDKALDERRNHVSNDLYHFEIKKSLEFFTSKFYPIWRSMLCDVITESKITWRYIRLLFNQTRQKLILLRFMIETNLFSLAASVMSSNLCWGSSILKIQALIHLSVSVLKFLLQYITNSCSLSWVLTRKMKCNTVFLIFSICILFTLFLHFFQPFLFSQTFEVHFFLI